MKISSAKESLFRVSPMFAALAAVGFACAPTVPLQNRPCPCADGWVCCQSENVCAESADSCPGGSPTSGSDAGVNFGGSGGTTPVMMPTDASIDVQQGSPLTPTDAGLPTLPNPTFTVQPTLLGTWTGYFENFTFPSTSDAIRLSLTQSSDGSGKVSVVLGMGTPPAPPTDPAADWPPSAAPIKPDPSSLDKVLGGYIEGFAYDAYEVRWTEDRLQFVINNFEPFRPYCQLQTSYLTTNAGYQCIPGGSGGGSGLPDGGWMCEAGNGQTVSCEQAFYCDQLCTCVAAGCGASVKNTTSFDITFSGTKGDGNVTIDSGKDVMLTQVVSAPDGGQP
jgi:hypothetical protein